MALMSGPYLRGSLAGEGVLDLAHDEAGDESEAVADLFVEQIYLMPSVRSRWLRSLRIASTYSSPVKFRPTNCPRWP